MRDPTIIGYSEGAPVADPREFAESDQERESRWAFYDKVHGNMCIGHLAGLNVVDDLGQTLYTVPARTHDGEPILPQDDEMLRTYLAGQESPTSDKDDHC